MSSGTNRSGERGAVLIVAMLLAAIIAVALASFIKLSTSSLNLGRRNFYGTAALNLAEAGLERALYCVNRNQVDGVALATAWSSADGWTTNSGTHVATATFSGFTPGPNATGSTKVYVRNYDLTGTVLMVAKSTITVPDGGPPLEKFIEVTLASRSVFAGLVAKTSLRGDSNLYVDSWISTNPSTGAFTPYSTAVRRGFGPLGVVASGNGALNVGDNPTIYGTVNTGGGTIGRSGSAKLTSTPGGSGWNTALENRSFTYAFPTVTVPTPSAVNTISTNITSNVTFPRGGDVAASDGKYYYNFASGKVISYAANTMTIKQPVVFMMTNHTGVNAISTSDHATFTYGTAAGDNGSLTIYTNGNINFDSGANWFANGAPARTTIYGTASSSQTFTTRGGGTFYGSVIAENAAINFDSGTNVMGAFCCNTMQLLGGVNFHYDEALGSSGGGGYRITKWKELQTAAERNVYASALSF
ncbi:MAG: hypothetical protein HZA32_02890 [Opitutae bacterium]|nr:hypothetical protein [Opitutae bacterium]